jgi:hypothetical protein
MALALTEVEPTKKEGVQPTFPSFLLVVVTEDASLKLLRAGRVDHATSAFSDYFPKSGEDTLKIRVRVETKDLASSTTSRCLPLVT